MGRLRPKAVLQTKLLLRQHPGRFLRAIAAFGFAKNLERLAAIGEFEVFSRGSRESVSIKFTARHGCNFKRPSAQPFRFGDRFAAPGISGCLTAVEFYCYGAAYASPAPA